jgi:prepilin-type N-terminal cleavage/methylation domain-containing protein
MTGLRGFTLIEVIVVMAIIAITLGMAGPRIGAGFGRLELNESAQQIRNFVRIARLQAERTDREQYVVLNKTNRSISLVDSDLQVLREEHLPSSVEIVLSDDASVEALYVAPSGITRGAPFHLRGRTGETEVSLQ